jgi:hypothetical protein
MRTTARAASIVTSRTASSSISIVSASSRSIRSLKRDSSATSTSPGRSSADLSSPRMRWYCLARASFRRSRGSSAPPSAVSRRSAALMWPRWSSCRSHSRSCGSKRSSADGIRRFELKNRWLTVRISARSRPAAVSRSASPNPVMLRIIR